jgi:hypothetical protein
MPQWQRNTKNFEGVDADLQSWMEKAATFLARSIAEKYNPASLSTKVSI